MQDPHLKFHGPRDNLDNHRRLRELTAKLEQLSLRTAETAEGWQPKT